MSDKKINVTVQHASRAALSHVIRASELGAFVAGVTSACLLAGAELPTIKTAPISEVSP